VRLGSGVTLLQQYTSFGDLNHDGADDAAVILAKPSTAGGAEGGESYFLAAMLNQGGVMFDIAELPLGSTANINSHQIASGTIILGSNQYKLLGTDLLMK
jgi:hypothetical protein